MKTEIIAIIDRSGSMQNIAKDVDGGFAAFIKDQQAQPGEARLTLAIFDDQYELAYQGIPIKDAPTYQLRPRGGTALFDAIGRTLNDQGRRIAQEKWAELVIVNIITDGEENSSNEYTQERVKEMTAHAEANGWKFLFLAANQDAFGAARAFGSSGAYAGNFKATAQGVATAYQTSSATMSALRGGTDVQSLVQTSNPL